jgi:hypothetical protein
VAVEDAPGQGGAAAADADDEDSLGLAGLPNRWLDVLLLHCDRV